MNRPGLNPWLNQPDSLNKVHAEMREFGGVIAGVSDLVRRWNISAARQPYLEYRCHLAGILESRPVGRVLDKAEHQPMMGYR